MNFLGQFLYSHLFVINVHLTRQHFFKISSNNAEAFASELLENLEELFLSTTCIVMCLTCGNLKLHSNVLPVEKELTPAGLWQILCVDKNIDMIKIVY